MGPIINLISGTYSYVREGIHIYGIPGVPNNYPLVSDIF